MGASPSAFVISSPTDQKAVVNSPDGNRMLQIPGRFSDNSGRIIKPLCHDLASVRMMMLLMTAVRSHTMQGLMADMMLMTMMRTMIVVSNRVLMMQLTHGVMQRIARSFRRGTAHLSALHIGLGLIPHVRGKLALMRARRSLGDNPLGLMGFRAIHHRFFTC